MATDVVFVNFPATPNARKALPFTMRDGSEHYMPQSRVTPACRYWRGHKSIFITHFKWQVGQDHFSLSRLDVIDTFIKAHNLVNQLAILLSAIDPNRSDITSRHISSAERREYEELEAFLGMIELLRFFMNLCLGRLIPIDLSFTAPSAWREQDVPTLSRKYILQYIDAGADVTTFPFQVMRELQLVIANSDIEVLRSRYKVPSPILLKGPEGVWRSYIRDFPELEHDPENDAERMRIGEEKSVSIQPDGGATARGLLPSIFDFWTSMTSTNSPKTVSNEGNCGHVNVSYESTSEIFKDR